DDERERIQLDGSLSLHDRVVESAQCGQGDVAILLVRNRVIWVQLNRTLKFAIRLRGIEIVKPNRNRQRSTRFSESVVQLKGFLCRRLSFRVRISRSPCRVARQPYVTIRDSGVGKRVIRVCRDGLLKVIDRFLQVVTRALVPKESAL